MSYLGAFNKSFREQEIEKWMELLTNENILFSKEVNIRTTLADPIVVQSWNKAELSSDDFTIENAVIM